MNNYTLFSIDQMECLGAIVTIQSSVKTIPWIWTATTTYATNLKVTSYDWLNDVTCRRCTRC